MRVSLFGRLLLIKTLPYLQLRRTIPLLRDSRRRRDLLPDGDGLEGGFLLFGYGGSVALFVEFDEVLADGVGLVRGTLQRRFIFEDSLTDHFLVLRFLSDNSSVYDSF